MQDRIDDHVADSDHRDEDGETLWLCNFGEADERVLFALLFAELCEDGE